MRLPADSDSLAGQPRQRSAPAPQSATLPFDTVWSAVLAPATPPLPAPIVSPPARATATTAPQQQSGQGRQRARD